jgi:uncharacterized alpha-E superfamily protein
MTTRCRPSCRRRRWAARAGIELLLELFDSAITFRARYQRHDDLLALTDLLVLDSANPRALPACCAGCAPNWASCPGARVAGAAAGPAAGATGPA